MRVIANISGTQSDVVTQYQEELQKLAAYIQELENSLTLLKKQSQSTAKKTPSSGRKTSPNPREMQRVQGMYEKESQKLQRMEKEFS